MSSLFFLSFFLRGGQPEPSVVLGHDDDDNTDDDKDNIDHDGATDVDADGVAAAANAYHDDAPDDVDVDDAHDDAHEYAWCEVR